MQCLKIRFIILVYWAITNGISKYYFKIKCKMFTTKTCSKKVLIFARYQVIGFCWSLWVVSFIFWRKIIEVLPAQFLKTEPMLLRFSWFACLKICNVVRANIFNAQNFWLAKDKLMHWCIQSNFSLNWSYRKKYVFGNSLFLLNSEPYNQLYSPIVYPCQVMPNEKNFANN